jgi:hypothetical protein
LVDIGNYCKCVLNRREGIVRLVDIGNYCKCVLNRRGNCSIG